MKKKKKAKDKPKQGMPPGAYIVNQTPALIGMTYEKENVTLNILAEDIEQFSQILNFLLCFSEFKQLFGDYAPVDLTKRAKEKMKGVA